MKETIKSIIEWHEQTFPDATRGGQIEKWHDEEKEFKKTIQGTEEELYELADMVIVSTGIMRFSYKQGFDYLARTLQYMINADYVGQVLWEAVELKMQINRKRKWNKIGNKFQHISEGGEE
jgi:hypothetical protein